MDTDMSEPITLRQAADMLMVSEQWVLDAWNRGEVKMTRESVEVYRNELRRIQREALAELDTLSQDVEDSP